MHSHEQSNRLHGLDALRGSMMLLVLVFHAAFPYGTVDRNSQLSWKDPLNTHAFFDGLLNLIGIFQMPVFFVMAGFFGALLFYDRSPRAMILNRIQRIVIPFIIAFIVISPLTYWAYIEMTFRLDGIPWSFGGALDALLKSVNHFALTVRDGSATTLHLWFLYYLIYFSFAGWGAALLLRKLPGLTSFLKRLFEAVHRFALIKYSVLTLITATLLYFTAFARPSALRSLAPNPPQFLYHLVFYLYGWLLFPSRQLLERFTKNAWVVLAASLILFFSRYHLEGLERSLGFLPLDFILSALSTWLFIFGITGLAIKHANMYSARIRYVADASYWVYLIHLPLTIFFSSLLMGINVSAFVKSFAVLLTTLGVCFLSYHYCVRSTWIGQLLNGRKALS